MVDTITAKVAAIIDETTLVLNVGSSDGVQEGMVFAIFVEYQEILDPDSGESLGKWEMVKARVTVEYVQDKLCTVRSTLRSNEDRPATLSAMMVQHSFGNFGQGSEQRERLEVRSADTAGRPQGQPIAVGDGARMIMPEDNAEVDPQTRPNAPPAESETQAAAVPPEEPVTEGNAEAQGPADQHAAGR